MAERDFPTGFSSGSSASDKLGPSTATRGADEPLPPSPLLGLGSAGGSQELHMHRFGGRGESDAHTPHG